MPIFLLDRRYDFSIDTLLFIIHSIFFMKCKLCTIIWLLNLYGQAYDFIFAICFHDEHFSLQCLKCIKWSPFISVYDDRPETICVYGINRLLYYLWYPFTGPCCTVMMLLFHRIHINCSLLNFCVAHQILNTYTNTKIEAWHWLAPVTICVNHIYRIFIHAHCNFTKAELIHYVFIALHKVYMNFSSTQ